MKVRLHDASAREQLMMIGSKLSNAHFPEFPEMVHLFPDVDVDLKSCRGGLVKFLFSKPLHWFLIVLLCLDVLLVITGLQLKIEVASLEGIAIASCLGLAIPSGNVSGNVEVQHTFLTVDEAKECIEENPEHKTAVVLEGIDHIFTIASISILVIFLVENIMFMFAFHLSYFKIIYFPFDLFVVLVSMATEILDIVHHDKDDTDVNTTASSGTASSLYRGGSPVAALLIIGRFWRFELIGHAVYLLQAAEEKEEELEELHDELRARQELAEKKEEEPDPSV